MNGSRESGVLLHPTSLPGPFGIGDIGPRAREFADSLAVAGQSLWQMLPLGPTGYGDSPYQALSSFAGNPLLLSPEDLREDGLISETELQSYPASPDGWVDFGRVIQTKAAMIAQACGRLEASNLRDGLRRFREENGERWLRDFALFSSLKSAHGLRPWPEWDGSLIQREPQALEHSRSRLGHEIALIEQTQFLFWRQWNRFLAHCAERGVRLIGDLPIYVAHDSADAWVIQEQLALDAHGMPTVVAGVPPDYFSSTGQRWGNPLYRWEAMEEDGFRWWVARIGRALELTNHVRIDHFRGFESYWEIPAEEPTAVQGRWVPAPGDSLFRTLQERFDPLPIIAEDLGIITQEVEALRRGFGLPGMRVLQFSFGGDPDAPDFGTRGYPENCICYTGTHDNDTLLGWIRGSPSGIDPRTPEQVGQERAKVLDYLGDYSGELHWALIELAMRSRAETAIVPLQDILGLGSEARVNVPSRAEGNWRWRVGEDVGFADALSRLRALSERTGRVSDSS